MAMMPQLSKHLVIVNKTNTQGLKYIGILDKAPNYL